MKNSTLKRWAPAACGLAISLASMTAEARPYASGVTNNAGVVSFILNEAADDVKVIFNGGASTNSMGARAKGTHNFNLGGNTSFQIHVTKNGGQGFLSASGTNAVVQMLSETNNMLLKYWNPRALAVNTNATSPHFGRIYVGNGTAGTPGGTSRFTDLGAFILNADHTGAHDNGSPDLAYNPNSVFSGAGASPYAFNIGPDDNIYFADWSDNFGNVKYVSPDMIQGASVLKDLETVATTPIGTNNTHGSITAVHVDGKLSSGNLTVYTVDEDMQTNKTSTATNQVNGLWRYDIGSGPLPYMGDATRMFTPNAIPNTGINTVGVHTGLHRGKNGYFYYVHNRQAGTDTSGLVVLDANGNHLWNSRSASIALIGGAEDILRLSVQVAITPDTNWIAVARAQNVVWIMPLTNGIPDLSKRLMLNAFGSANVSSTIHIRGLAFDAANNLYVINSSQEALRVFAPGGTATTITTSDGQFSTQLPSTTITVVATTATTTEGGTSGVFTFTRQGDTSGALSVGLNISGTAVNGTDYVTIATNVNFTAGSSTATLNVTPINDTEAEFSETVGVSIASSPNYTIGTASSATVTLLDNEPTVITIEATQPNLLESYVHSRANFQLSRKGLLGAITVNMQYSGPAANTVDFTGNTSVAFSANAATATLSLSPINNNSLSGTRAITATVASGSGYVAGAPASAIVNLLDDETAGSQLFSDNFATDTSANWSVVSTLSAPNFADFAWDYSTHGIPPAPSTTDNSTLGLRLRVNVGTHVANSSISAYPATANLTGDYRLKFDMWLNYNGPMFQGGSGSTLAMLAGIGSAGTLAHAPTNSDGFSLRMVIDGQDGVNAGDYTVYTNGIAVPDASGVYAAGTASGVKNNLHPFYSIWGNHAAPAAQLALFNTQTGNTEVGCIGMAWHAVAITKVGDVVTWSIDGLTVATVTNKAAEPFSTTGKAFLGFNDPYSGAAPDLCYALYDNVRIEAIAAVAPVLNMVRNGSNITLTWTGNYVLEQASALTGSPSDWSSTGASSGHVVDASSGIKFFRLRTP